MLITKDMGIMEIVQKYPATVEVLQRFGMGCIGCAAALFVYFLERNGLLSPERQLIEPNTLAAIALMVALSAPAEKDTMVALVQNLLEAE